MPNQPFEQSKPMSSHNWALHHHLPLEGATRQEERYQFQEYTWASQPDIGFVATHDKDKDHDGIKTVYFSLVRVETGEVTWADGTTSTLKRLVTEDLEGMAFNPAEFAYAGRREKALAAEMFGRHAVPRLAEMGTWKQAYALRAGDVVRASQNHEYEQPRTVQAVETAHDGYWGPKVKITWGGERPSSVDGSLGELSWVALDRPTE